VALVQLYSRSLDGHRASYVSFTGKLLGGHRTNMLGLMFSSSPVMFLMIEESFSLYVISSIWRSLFGWRTVGLLFRPKPALYGASVRLQLKRGLLKILRRIPSVKTLSIVPATLDSRISEIADDWLYDFQLWDMGDVEIDQFHGFSSGGVAGEAGELFSQLLKSAAGRKLLVAVGTQDRSKGFDEFAEFCVSPGVRDNWLCASGGKVQENCQSYKSQVEAAGGYVLDRFISNDELLALYAASSVVWCAYSESYDQASGILGRAVQFGIPVIVRAGSYSHRFCQVEGIAHLAFDGQAGSLSDVIAELPQPTRNESARRFRTISLGVIHRALWDRTAPEIDG
jgi:hypothetical protein